MKLCNPKLGDKVGKLETFAYGCGEISTCAVFSLATTLLVLFYTDYVGVSAAAVGMVVAISQIFNGTSDVLAGFIVDRTRSKHGRARVWELRMMIPYLVGMILLMTVPQQSTEFVKIIYIFLTYNFMLTVVYTMLQLPFCTSLSYMTRDAKKRAHINIIRMAMSPIGNVMITLLYLPLVRMLGDNQDAWIKVTVVYAVVLTGLMFFCFYNTKERVEVLDESGGDKVSLKRSIPALLKNKYFYIMFVYSMLFSAYQSLSGTMATYYCKWYIGNGDLMGGVNFAAYGIQVVVMLLLGKVLHKTTKRNWCIFGMALVALGSVVLVFAPANIPLVMFGALIRGVGMAPALGTIYSMIGDTIEYGQWRTGLRTAGAIQSTTTSGQKLGQGISAACIGFIMTASGYNSAPGVAFQSEGAIHTIYNLYIWGIVALCAAMVVVLLFYRLDKEYDGVMAELLEREQKLAVQRAHTGKADGGVRLPQNGVPGAALD